ncbi:MAG TPA: TonB-dependent receptor [Vicinamibacterales bacterium]|nr:TonB-dependent receptor [Vicinamibacterales bacterium]
MRCRYLVVFLLLHAMPAAAQAPSDFTQVNIEDLMNTEVQRVFGASERLQPVTEAPSSVTIVTAADIERYGYRTLADILRSARGFFVSNDRNYSYIGARGFARAGDYNTRVLLLINGHRFNDNIYDQAAIGGDFGVDVAMMDRVEIIRGPASSLYGTSAFFAVVNVITRSGASLNGVSVDVDAGTHGTAMARISGGRRFANGADLAVSSTVEGNGGEKHVYFPAFDTPETNHGVADQLDGEQIGHAYARLSAGNFAVTAAFGHRLKDVPTASFGTIFNEQISSEQTSDRHISVATEYNRTFGATRLALDAGFDRYDYEGRYPFVSDNAAYPVLLNHDAALGARWNAGVRLSRALPGRQMLSAGGIFYDNVRQNQWFSYNDPSVGSENLVHSSQQSGVYVQDEIRVRPWLLLNGGVRYDQYEQFSRATPRGAVIVSPWTGGSLKYLYGEAFRAPNAYELYYYGTTAPDLGPEFVRTNEVVWEQYLGERLRTSASAYHYTASQLITFQSVDSDRPQGDYGFVNDGVIRANGLELEAELRTKRGVQALTSYVLQRARQADALLTNSPQHMFKARVTVPVGPRAFTSAEWQLTGARSTLAGNTVGAVSVVNLTTGWPLTRMLSLTGSVANLFDQRYADPGSDEHVPDAIPQIGRSMRVGLRWTMRAR